jgi:hypothetical protein
MPQVRMTRQRAKPLQRQRPVGLSPSAAYPPLDDDQVAPLRRIGDKWHQALGDGRRSTLPVDPGPRVSAGRSSPRRGRFVSIRLDSRRASNLAATEQVSEEAEPTLARLRRVIVGPPLQSGAVARERMRKLIALPVRSSDALSSVAYGPEAMLAVLVLGGHRALGLSLPVAGAIALLMVAVGLSYRQTIRAYPGGGAPTSSRRRTSGLSPGWRRRPG